MFSRKLKIDASSNELLLQWIADKGPQKKAKRVFIAISSEEYYDLRFTKIYWTKEFRRKMRDMNIKWEYIFDDQSLSVAGTDTTIVSECTRLMIARLIAYREGRLDNIAKPEDDEAATNDATCSEKSTIRSLHSASGSSSVVDDCTVIYPQETEYVAVEDNGYDTCEELLTEMIKMQEKLIIQSGFETCDELELNETNVVAGLKQSILTLPDTVEEPVHATPAKLLHIPSYARKCVSRPYSKSVGHDAVRPTLAELNAIRAAQKVAGSSPRLTRRKRADSRSSLTRAKKAHTQNGAQFIFVPPSEPIVFGSNFMFQFTFDNSEPMTPQELPSPLVGKKGVGMNDDRKDAVQESEPVLPIIISNGFEKIKLDESKSFAEEIASMLSFNAKLIPSELNDDETAQRGDDGVEEKSLKVTTENEDKANTITSNTQSRNVEDETANAESLDNSEMIEKEIIYSRFLDTVDVAKKEATLQIPSQDHLQIPEQVSSAFENIISDTEARNLTQEIQDIVSIKKTTEIAPRVPPKDVFVAPARSSSAPGFRSNSRPSSIVSQRSTTPLLTPKQKPLFAPSATNRRSIYDLAMQLRTTCLSDDRASVRGVESTTQLTRLIKRA